MSIKVLIIHNRIHLGGPIYVVAYLTKYLDNRFETKLIVGPPLDDEISAEYLLDEMEITHTLIPEMQRSFNPFMDIISFIKIRKIIREFKPDIVHTHTTKPGVLGRLAAYLCKVPIIIHTYHGHIFHSYFSGFTSAAIRSIECLLAKISTAIIAISDVQKQEIVDIYKITGFEKAKVIPLGIDLDKFAFNKAEKRVIFRKKYNLQENDVAFAHIGRFAPVKNHMLLFEALEIIKTKRPEIYQNIVIFLIGDGELKRVFQQKLEHCNIAYSEKNRDFEGGGVIFTSWIKEIDQVVPGFDAVVLTSHNEGTPSSLIESQAAGVPVISSAVGGVINIVADGTTGLLIPTGDKVSLANAMIRFATNPDERKNMGNAAQEWTQSKFSYKRLISDTTDLYLSLYNKKNKINTQPNPQKK